MVSCPMVTITGPDNAITFTQRFMLVGDNGSGGGQSPFPFSLIMIGTFLNLNQAVLPVPIGLSGVVLGPGHLPPLSEVTPLGLPLLLVPTPLRSRGRRNVVPKYGP